MPSSALMHVILKFQNAFIFSEIVSPPPHLLLEILKALLEVIVRVAFFSPEDGKL